MRYLGNDQTLTFRLKKAERQEIAVAIKHDKRPEVRQRAMGLRLLHEGQSPKKGAEFMAISQPTVYDWHHRWQENGLAGLANRPKSGRPPKTDESHLKLLEQVVEQDPQELAMLSAFGP